MSDEVVMIIRHAEKPKDSPTANGVTVDGVENKKSLTPVGWARAGALVGLFAPADPAWLRPGLYRPAAVFASNTRGPGGGSEREEETVRLLSERLGVETDLDHGVGEEESLVAALQPASGPILISWEHKRIPAVAKLLGQAAPGAPEEWPKDRYDMVWVFRRADSTEPWSFTQVPELLLAGDSAEPI